MYHHLPKPETVEGEHKELNNRLHMQDQAVRLCLNVITHQLGHSICEIVALEKRQAPMTIALQKAERAFGFQNSKLVVNISDVENPHIKEHIANFIIPLGEIRKRSFLGVAQDSLSELSIGRRHLGTQLIANQTTIVEPILPVPCEEQRAKLSAKMEPIHRSSMTFA